MSNTAPTPARFTAALIAELETIDALRLDVLADRIELSFNSYENARGVNHVVVSPAGRDAITGDETFTVSAFRSGRHFGEASRLRGQAKAVFACSVREVIESQVWS